jgi:hypothetical protein
MTFNYKTGLFRSWLVLSLLWVAGTLFMASHPGPVDASDWGLAVTVPLIFGVLLSSGVWAIRGFGVKEPPHAPVTEVDGAPQNTVSADAEHSEVDQSGGTGASGPIGRSGWVAGLVRFVWIVETAYIVVHLGEELFGVQWTPTAHTRTGWPTNAQMWVDLGILAAYLLLGFLAMAIWDVGADIEEEMRRFRAEQRAHVSASAFHKGPGVS